MFRSSLNNINPTTMPSDSKVQAKKSKKRALEDAEEPTPAPVAGPSKPKPKLPAIVGMDDDGAEESDTEVAESASASAPGNPKKKHKSKGKSAGIVYISRLPPGMTPQKVRHLMARWGDVGRLYAQHRDAPSGYNAHHQEDKKQKKRHTSANYNEAWVEFLDKSVAKTVAKMLNAQVIGGKKGDRWRDDIWTMKYLSGFKWEMLGEQVAYERQVHQSRLRAEVQRSKAEQGAYLQNVELARVLKKREEKRGAAEASTSGSGATAPAGDAASTQDKDKDSKGKRSYKQRQVQDRAHGLEAKGMDDVLGNIFG